MKFGVYKKIEVSGRGQGGGLGEFYQFLLLVRDHYTGAESVIYTPLRMEPNWVETLRCCSIPRADFERMFIYVGEGVPKPD